MSKISLCDKWLPKKLVTHFAEILDFFLLLSRTAMMPNVPLGTMGGHVWWKDLASYNGMRLQQNHITKHCRLLDKNDRRIAWGSYDAMEKAMKRIMNLQKMAAANTESKSQSDMQKMEQLKKLKELLDLGILTETEYAEKKAKILAEI